MAEVIGETVAAGHDQREIIAGLYDSIIQSYLYRVKGNRSVGSVIFCQGMPFASDALAAVVARQSGSGIIIPPNPGTVGALGIALLARKETNWSANRIFDPQGFLDARIESKETFVCRSKTGCGGAGNRFRIDRSTRSSPGVGSDLTGAAPERFMTKTRANASRPTSRPIPSANARRS